MFDKVVVFDAIGGKLPRSIWEMDNVPIGTLTHLRLMLEKHYWVDVRYRGKNVTIMIRDYYRPVDVLEQSEYRDNVVKYQS